MIVYTGRFGQYLGQAAPAPDVTAAPPPPPAPSAISRDLASLDQKVTISKAGLIVGGLVLAGLTLTLSGSLLLRP
jgi:hypothetical protein